MGRGVQVLRNDQRTTREELHKLRTADATRAKEMHNVCGDLEKLRHAMLGGHQSATARQLEDLQEAQSKMHTIQQAGERERRWLARDTSAACTHCNSVEGHRHQALLCNTGITL
jgi:hypothetical protein